MSKPFGFALEAVKAGERVARAGWNGKGMWLELVRAEEWDSTAPGIVLHELRKLPFIAMRTADGGFVPWLASQTDMLAEDWTILGPND